ncbi:MAG TPA: hypothetical protein VNR36_10075 [Pseudolysinimonas sp.]|nr:hypothetical protein [Pseudolysinimonas sp.]
MSRRRTGLTAILLTGVLLAVAFTLRLTQPSDEELQGPFVTFARFGEQVEGRNLTWIAEDAYLADRVTALGWSGETDGVWLVVTGTIGSKLGVTSPDVSLRIGDRRYMASDRPDAAALGGSLRAGLPQSGAFVFELPRSALEGPDARSATARFATGFRVRLDSAIDMVLDLTALEHRSTAALPPPGEVIP